MDDFRVRTVADLLGSILTPDAADTVRSVSAFYSSWKSIAGERLAAHSRPVDIRNGVVFIEADHPGWIQMLQMRQDDLLTRLQERGRELGISGIAFRLAHDPSLPGTARRTYRAADAGVGGVPDTGPDGPEEGADGSTVSAASRELSASTPSERPAGPLEDPEAGTATAAADSLAAGEFRDILASLEKTLRSRTKK